MAKEKVFITGGTGFIGSALSRRFLSEGKNVDCFDILDPKSVSPVTVSELQRNSRFNLIRGDLRDTDVLEEALRVSKPDLVVHCGAISAVDRSIKNPGETFDTNITGTKNVVEGMRFAGIKRIHYISTDEVFGQALSGSFDENSPMNPRNPYAAGKAGGEMVVLAWSQTYGLEPTITNCGNNYGPYQAPDKLIPRLTVRGIQGNSLPVYGTGQQEREWVHVDDHVDAVMKVIEQGTIGERYCVGSGESLKNIDVVNAIMNVIGLDDSVIEHVEDRPGHDFRYSIDSSKIRGLGWVPDRGAAALADVIHWYKSNPEWWSHFTNIYPDLLLPVKPQAS